MIRKIEFLITMTDFKLEKLPLKKGVESNYQITTISRLYSLFGS